MPALLKSGGPRRVLTGSRAMRTLAAIGRSACMAGSWRDAGAADGVKAEAHGRVRERGAHAHCVRDRGAHAHCRRLARMRGRQLGRWLARKRCRRRGGRVSYSRARARRAGTLPSGGAHVRQAAGVMPALLTAGEPHLMLMSLSVMRVRAAVGQHACTAGGWREASTAGGVRAASRAHMRGRGAQARCHRAARMRGRQLARCQRC